ncbi:MAG: RagB/SusD family nutrient uptake outer membrane protein [Bacteroidota bacterium]
MNNKLNKLICLVAIVATFAIGGCKKTSDLLLLRDTEGVDAQIWEEEAAVQYFLNEAYNMIMPEFIYQYTANNHNIHIVSDENYLSANDAWGKKVFNFNGVLISNDSRYIGAKYAGANIGENRYFDIAKCNLAIANLPNSKGITGAANKKLIGQFYALRGMAYLALTKYYGGVPLVLDPQNPASLTLSGRVKAKGMFEQIVKDFDSAIVNLEGVVWVDATERGKITRQAAAALKAKALLWWASPLFNPTNDPNHPFEAARWQKAFEATKAAYDMCLALGHKLMTDYSRIFQVEGAANTEAIIVRSYSSTQVKRNHGVEARSRPSSERGSPSDWYLPSTQMLDAYLMKDGLPIAQSSSYDPVLFWANRDPRFDASIAYNGSTWKLSGKNNRRQWTYNTALNNGVNDGSRGFYVKRFSSPDLADVNVAVANDVGGSGMDWIELRLAEVMMDYAEAANETGNLAVAKDIVKQLRQRAGIIAGGYNYGLDMATNTAQMRDLIMNERMVEFAFEGKRNDDLRRTRRMHLLTGILGSMQIEAINKVFLETPVNASNPAVLNRDTINMNNKASVLQHFKYPYRIVFPSGNGAFGMPAFYYFFGIHNQFLNSTPLIEQTIGWDGGTFDPL